MTEHIEELPPIDEVVEEDLVADWWIAEEYEDWYRGIDTEELL